MNELTTSSALAPPTARNPKHPASADAWRKKEQRAKTTVRIQDWVVQEITHLERLLQILRCVNYIGMDEAHSFLQELRQGRGREKEEDEVAHISSDIHAALDVFVAELLAKAASELSVMPFMEINLTQSRDQRPSLESLLTPPSGCQDPVLERFLSTALTYMTEELKKILSELDAASRSTATRARAATTANMALKTQGILLGIIYFIRSCGELKSGELEVFNRGSARKVSQRKALPCRALAHLERLQRNRMRDIAQGTRRELLGRSKGAC